jgi:3-oxoacyl-[acyl-carrier protein] reductase
VRLSEVIPDDSVSNLLLGRRVVVTGAAQGIGYEIASVFASHGASVAVVDINEGLATSASSIVTRDGAVSVGIACDVADELSVAAAFAVAASEMGGVNVLVNNAGIVRDSTMLKMTLEDFRAVIEVNLVGAWIATRAAAELMKSDGGSIINMSSVAGKVGNFGQSNYSAAKAGLIGLTKSTAKELAKYRIRVNAIMPGLIRTPMTFAMPPSAWDAKMAEIPLGRAGEPHEVAGVATFLASDLSSYVTGATVEVTGGRYM